MDLNTLKPQHWDPAKNLDAPLRWRKPRLAEVSLDFRDHEQTAAIFGVMAATPSSVYMVTIEDVEAARTFFNWVGEVAHLRLFPSWYTGDRTLDASAVMQYVQGPHRDGYCKICRDICRVVMDEWAPAWPLPNALLGAHLRTQAQADALVPGLLALPAALRWLWVTPRGRLSVAEYLPMPLEAGARWRPCVCESIDEADRPCLVCEARSGLGWVIVTPDGEPLHPDNVRALRDECVAAGVPFRFDGWGAWYPTTEPNANNAQREGWRSGLQQKRPGREQSYRWPDGAISDRVGKARADRLLDGRVWDGYPEVGR